DEAETVPEEVAAGSADEKSTLADPDRGLRPHAGQALFELAQLDALTLRGALGERRPRLAALAHVLALVLADRSARRLRRAGRLLHPAGDADERGRAHAVRRS